MDPTCLAIKLSLVPVFLLLAVATAYFIYLRAKETDLIKKDRLTDRARACAALTVIALIAVPLTSYLLEAGFLPYECSETQTTTGNCKTIDAYADDTKNKTIIFGAGGGTNRDITLKVPREGIKSAYLEITHADQNIWMDDFDGPDRIAEYTNMDLNRTEDKKEGYVFVNMSRLEVYEQIVLNGEKYFDEVVIHPGGMITTDNGKTLSLEIRESLIIEEGGGIDVSSTNRDENIGGTTRTERKISGSGGGGGGHGGAGGKGGDDPPEYGGGGGMPYDSETEPEETGQRGGHGGGSTYGAGSMLPGAGGAGGGAVKIKANRIVVDGYIKADGGDAADGDGAEGTGGGGGGSGGSIYLLADTLEIYGTLSANGGRGGSGGGNSKDGGGGGGGGGRIAVAGSIRIIAGDLSADGGRGGSGNGAGDGTAGGDGSITESRKDVEVPELILANMSSVVIAPDNLECFTKFHANASVPSGSQLRYGIIDAETGEVLCEYRADENVTEYDITDCSRCKKALVLRADLDAIAYTKSPRIYFWGLSYTTKTSFSLDFASDYRVEYNVKDETGRTFLSDESTPPLKEVLEGIAKGCACSNCRETEDGMCVFPLKVDGGTKAEIFFGEPEIEYCV